jgi:site-specific recombinase XerD
MGARTTGFRIGEKVSLMSKDTAISMAVAMIDTKQDLERIVTGIEMMHQIQLNHQHIQSIWHDIKRVPVSYAL